MGAYLAPEEARERLERGEALDAGIGRLYRAHGNRIEFCDPHGWEESRRHGGIRELVETVQLRVPAPRLADDLREMIATIRTELESRTGEGRIDLGLVAARLRDILHKHGECE